MGSLRIQRFLTSLAGMGAIALGCSMASAAPVAGPAANTGGDVHAQQWKLVEGYCFKCHNTEDWAGSVAFDTMSA
ncbi:MAG: hypothetical protein ABI616_11105, partial [Pseudomonadota bacterium]